MVVVLNMPDKKIKICFISAEPNFDGGVSLYTKNIIKCIKKNKKDTEITWIYVGKKAQIYTNNGVRYIEIKSNLPYPLDQISGNFKIYKFLKKNDFDIINSHAVWGRWM
ncbi:MAG TPA: glycosyltransferase, partial [Candidatus Pacearchaeota archaeon]|nr:glycosyltransferase [Candidatus Pacearchaeota archaeon]